MASFWALLEKKNEKFGLAGLGAGRFGLEICATDSGLKQNFRIWILYSKPV